MRAFHMTASEAGQEFLWHAFKILEWYLEFSPSIWFCANLWLKNRKVTHISLVSLDSKWQTLTAMLSLLCFLLYLHLNFLMLPYVHATLPLIKTFWTNSPFNWQPCILLACSVLVLWRYLLFLIVSVGLIACKVRVLLYLKQLLCHITLNYWVLCYFYIVQVSRIKGFWSLKKSLLFFLRIAFLYLAGTCFPSDDFSKHNYWQALNVSANSLWVLLFHILSFKKKWADF